uniref:protein-tyrosine-phosphatase n=1 Tax=Onchocerca flexuosa TaxID=387005 RepID=A0A183H1S1_9BILA
LQCSPRNFTETSTTVAKYVSKYCLQRGSSVSLTIDLGQFQSSALEISPIHEDIAEDLECNRPGCMTRYQLHRLDISASLSMIYAEFAALPSPSTSSCEKIAGCSQKNRYTLWPIRETRVRLSSSYRASCNSAAEEVCQSYINANYILDSNSELMYIAAEGPMPNTINDFWSMVLQERTPVIVMVTNLEEKPCGAKLAIKKCEKYWPDSHACYGKIDVTIVSTNFHSGVQIRHIVLNCGDLEHHVRHIWFTEWLDHRLPMQHITQLLKIIAAMESYRNEYRRLFSHTAPVLVHCSAGIGRTCTFIAIALGVDQLCKTPENIDVFSTVSRLRRQRFGAVQLPGQYAFIYLVLQRMERLLPELCAENDQDKFPACLTFSVFDFQTNNSQELLCGKQRIEAGTEKFLDSLFYNIT